MICKFYRFIKSRVGCSLKRTHCRRHLVPPGKQVAYQLPKTQGSLSSLKRVPRPLYAQDSNCRDRQHHSGVTHKQGGLPSNMQQVAPASTRPICHEVQQQVALVCVTGTGSPGYSSDCTQFAMVGSGSIHLPTVSHIGQSGDVAGLPIQENHSDCSGVAHHALDLGPSDHVQLNPTEPAQSVQPVDTTIHSDSSQKSDKS